MNKFVYNYIKNERFIFLFINVSALTLICMLFYYIILTNIKYSDGILFLKGYFFCIPTLIQTILSLVIFQNNRNLLLKKIITILYLSLFISFVIIFIKTNILKKYDFFDLVFYISIYQIILEIIFILIVSIFLKKLNINKKIFYKIISILSPVFLSYIIYNTKFFIERYCVCVYKIKVIHFILSKVEIFSFIFVFLCIINIFNPVLIYILSSMANGKLLLDDGKENEKKSNIKIE